jgi:glycosyltransferase involved in cell wall biosynthesis
VNPSAAPAPASLVPRERVRVAFVNGGILGLAAFHRFLIEYLPRQSIIDGEHIVLTENLTVTDRVIRRVMCQRLWKDGTFGLVNMDLARFRQELHAGVLARRRLTQLPHPDVIYFHRQATAYGSLDLMQRIPSIVSIDCTQECVLEDATSGPERASYEPNLRLDGSVFRRAAAIVATSQWAADSVRTLHPCSTAPIHVIPNAVLLAHFDPAWIEQRRARARAGALPRFLFMGGDFVRKGGYDLLEAWRAGGFADRATLEIVTDWNVEGALPHGATITRRIGPHSAEWSARWAAADVFVMPTRNEAFGLVFQEAAAAGIPAIGTRHNAIPEIIRDGETGLLVPPRNPEALIAAMETLLASAELRQRLGARGREVIEQIASPDRYLERLTAVVVGASRRSRSSA